MAVSYKVFIFIQDLKLKDMCVNREMENMDDEPTYSIKITGNGSFAGIMNALRSIADEMDLILESGVEVPESIKWEDDILMTEIMEE